LKTAKGTKQLKLDPSIYESLQKVKARKYLPNMFAYGTFSMYHIEKNPLDFLQVLSRVAKLHHFYGAPASTQYLTDQILKMLVFIS
jgi:hypothetical protein